MIKKTLLISAVLTIISLNTFAQNVNIPDANFKSNLVGNSAINTNSDSEIQVSEASAYTGTIYCSGNNISNLTGIEAFTSIVGLHCDNNSINNLDVSQNTALKILNCSNNNLTALDVSQNTALIGLNFLNNNLTSMGLSQNTSLISLNCGGNNLTALNVDQNTALEELFCQENNLNALNVSQNTALTTLLCNQNSLTSLDVSQSPSLSFLNCQQNSLTELNMKNISTTILTGSYPTEFHADSNNLTCIEVDDVAASTAAWTNIDPGVSFGLDCNYMGVNDMAFAQNISLYPNPTSAMLTINSDKSIVSITIVDVMGRAIKTILPTDNSINVSSLSKGMYFVQIHTDKGTVSKKIIKE